MIRRDVTELAAAIRRLDASAALRSFVAPGVFVAALGNLALGALAGLDAGWVTALIATAVLIVFLSVSIALSMVSMVLADGAARQPWRTWSSVVALLAGVALITLYVFLAGVVLWALMALAFREEFRQEVAFYFSDLAYAFSALTRGELYGIYELLLGPLIGLVLIAYVLPTALIWLMRVETQLASPSPRAELLGDVSGGGFWVRVAYVFGLPSSMWRGDALRTPAAWMFVGARGLVYAAFASFTALGAWAGDPFAPEWAPVLALGVFLVLLVGGHVLFAMGKRAAARRIWAPERVGNPAPILFLRSFENDQFRFSRPWWDLVGRWFDLWSFRRNADEMLIDEFAWYAPVIALGRPGETATPFGADRRYVTHEDWQGVVEDAAQRASAIVVAAGDTPGLVWEYELIRSKGYSGKTIFLFPPPRARGAEMARILYRKVFGSTPEETGDRALVALAGDAVAGESIHARRPGATAYLAALREFLQMREAAAGRPVGDAPVKIHPLFTLLGGVVLGVLVGGLLIALAADF